MIGGVTRTAEGVCLELQDTLWLLSVDEAKQLAALLTAAVSPRCPVPGCWGEAASWKGMCQAHLKALKLVLGPIIAERDKSYEAIENEYQPKLDAARAAWRREQGLNEEEA